MRQFEYLEVKVCRNGYEELVWPNKFYWSLDELGANGWELTKNSGDILLFKRVVPEKVYTKNAPSLQKSSPIQQISDSPLPEFEIDDGVLKNYNGKEPCVIVPDSVAEIGEYAFLSSGMTEIILPQNIRRIGKRAFSGCKNLKSIILPNKLIIVDDMAFSNCNSLEYILFNDRIINIGENILRYSNNAVICGASKQVEQYAKKNKIPYYKSLEDLQAKNSQTETN